MAADFFMFIFYRGDAAIIIFQTLRLGVSAVHLKYYQIIPVNYFRARQVAGFQRVGIEK